MLHFLLAAGVLFIPNKNNNNDNLYITTKKNPFSSFVVVKRIKQQKEDGKTMLWCY